MNAVRPPVQAPSWLFPREVRGLSPHRSLIREVVREVAAAVEQLTGWRNLTQGLQIELVSDLGEAHARMLASLFADGQPGPVRREMLRESQREGVSVYEPLQKTLLLSRSRLQGHGLDGLRLILGHELVHVGQFERYPALLPLWREHMRQRWEQMDEGLPPEGWVRESSPLVANLEGYAAYIEQDFLRKLYPASGVPHLELLARLGSGWSDPYTRAEMGQVFDPQRQWEDGYASFQRDQGCAGLRFYRQRQRGERPAAFDPALRVTPPPMAPLALAHLRRQAEQGSALHQQSLGTLLALGSAVPLDLDEAERWLLKAAKQGNLVAANNLALLCLLPRGQHDAALRWLLVAAEGGLPTAQTSAGYLHLHATSPDLARAAYWLQRAAEAGDANGQAWLGRLYLQGQGVPRSSTRGLAWLHQAARQGHGGARRELIVRGSSAP